MGNWNSFKIRDNDLSALQKSTRVLNQTEILHIYKRWHELYTNYNAGPEQLRSNIDTDGYADLDACLPSVYVMDNLEQLQENPFKDRIVKVFSQSGDDNMSFVEFLDMIAHFSHKMPVKRKIPIAFRIYDFDEDSIISRNDIKMMMDRLTGPDDALTEEVKKTIVDKVFEEACKDEQSIGLNLFDFKVIISKSPDFALTFGFNL